MRPMGALMGVALLLYASQARAVAPIFTETPLRDTPAAARILARLAQKPPGVDRGGTLRAATSGTYKAIVILLEFQPDPAVPGDPGVRADTLAHPPSAYESLLFSVGTHPTGSLRDYYREISRGTFDVEGVVTRWYTAPHHYAYYTAGQSGFGLPPNNAQQMARDAVELADQDLDFSQFDNDGTDGIPGSPDDNGIVDAVFVVHAGPGGEETAPVSDDIISHKWNLQGSYVSNDGIPTEVNEYTTEPEKWAGLAPYTLPNELMSIGVFCHEFGHLLGLPDLYDTRNDPAASEGVGEWDLMGSGNYNHLAGETLGTSPAHMSAWCKHRLGWVTQSNVAVDATGVTIAPVESGGSVYRLWTDGGASNEYFLIENRQPIGFDAGLVRRSIEIDGEPSHGLVIYHVDDALAGLDEPNNDPAHKLLDVVEAGGAESVVGVQNLDVRRNAVVSQSACGMAVNVTGNRGDRRDPWPGALSRSDFNANSCPSSATYCGSPSQVAVRSIEEIGQDIFADLYVTGARVRHGLPLIDDSPSIVPANNGNGMAESGESILLQIPLVNLRGTATKPLYAKVASLDAYTTFGAGDSIDYGSIGPVSTQPGTDLLVEIHPGPDPVGAGISYSVFSGAGLVRSETVQLPVGVKLGICDDFEGTARRWEGVPADCWSPTEWHREAGTNHTPAGSWAWKLGPVGPLGSYADSEDARLVSQPIRLAGLGDTLSFWQRYGTDGVADGLSVEISVDAGATWTLLQPIGGYSLGDRWSGDQPAFAQVLVPLTGYSGVVQVAFRFRSEPPLGGVGWWIDDVFVTGNTGCTTTGVEILDFWARLAPSGRAVRLAWDLGAFEAAILSIDRAAEGGPRERVATLASTGSPTGEYEDAAVTPGRRYLYWLGATREGLPGVEYGPVAVEVPASAGMSPSLALGRVSPNPFNPRATVTVTLDRDGPYVLRVFRADGRLVRTIHDGHGVTGPHRFTWDGTDDRGAAAGTGIYLFELRSGGGSRVEKAVLLR